MDIGEWRLAKIREGIEGFLGQYGDSTIPMFRVAQDLAHATLNILDGKLDDDAELDDDANVAP